MGAMFLGRDTIGGGVVPVPGYCLVTGGGYGRIRSHVASAALVHAIWVIRLIGAEFSGTNPALLTFLYVYR